MTPYALAAATRDIASTTSAPDSKFVPTGAPPTDDADPASALASADTAAPRWARPDTAAPRWARPDPAATEALGEEIARLSAHMHAAEYRLLTLLREFDERAGWGPGGFRSCAHWLSWRTGLSIGPAREKVRVARALAELPRIGARMERGQFSYSKVRALSRVATAANEAELIAFAGHATVAQVERLVRGWRQVDAIEARAEESRHERRCLRVIAEDDGMYVVRGRLEPEVGALLMKALADASLELFRSEPHATAQQRRADALGEILRAGEGPSFQALLHVSADGGAQEESARESGARDDDESGGVGGARTEEGVGVSAETSARLTCDADVRVVLHGSGTKSVGARRAVGSSGSPGGGSGGSPGVGGSGSRGVGGEGGEVLDVGRRRRTVPARMRTALEVRDGGRCRFPGCEAKRCDAHHVRHWSSGGETKLQNLMLLCRFHHRLVHEGGYRVEISEPTGGGFRFRRPDGRELTECPPVDAVAAGSDHRLRCWDGQDTIDPRAMIPQGLGERVDYSWAIEEWRVL